MENEILKLKLVNVSHLSLQFQDVGMASEPTGAGIQEWGNDTLLLLIIPFRVHILKAH